MSDPKTSVISMFEEGWNKGNVDVFASTIADSVAFHYAGSPREMSREQLNAIVLRWRGAFPDLHMNVDQVIAEDDIVAARLTMSGTHKGEWGGIGPTGRQVTMAITMFFRFVDGQMVELWESDDQLGFRQQIGMYPFESDE